MKTTDVSRAALGRIPVYLRFLESLLQDTETVSATVIAKELGFGEVQVRKDLGAICGSGKPRIGYTVSRPQEMPRRPHRQPQRKGGHSRRGKARQSAARLRRIFRLRA